MIEQLVMSSSVKFFGETVAKIYGLRLATEQDYDLKAPTLFWGNYTGFDSTRIMCHTGETVLVWAGGDLLNENNINRVRSKDMKHIAISTWIHKKLTARGIMNEYKILPATDIDFWKPEKLGNKVYAYAPDMPIYRRYLVDELQKEIPFEMIITDSAQDFSKQELREKYKQCFIGLRLTWWDGCAATVQELGLMGRRSVWNGGSTPALAWKTKQDVIDLIMQESKNIGKRQDKIARATHKELSGNLGFLSDKVPATTPANSK